MTHRITRAHFRTTFQGHSLVGLNGYVSMDITQAGGVKYCLPNNAILCYECVSLSAHELQTDERQRDLAVESNLRDIGARSKRNGACTFPTRSGLQRPSSALFKRPAAVGDCQLVGCLWRRQQRAGAGWWWGRCCCLHHWPSSRRPYLGHRIRPGSSWLPHLLWNCPGNVFSAPWWGRSRQRHHLYSDGTHQRNDLLFRDHCLWYDAIRERFLERSLQYYLLTKSVGKLYLLTVRLTPQHWHSAS